MKIQIRCRSPDVQAPGNEPDKALRSGASPGEDRQPRSDAIAQLWSSNKGAGK
jgi:hypothetical protein